MLHTLFFRNARRFCVLAVLLIAGAFTFSGCKSQTEDNSEQGAQETAEQVAPEFPKFSTEIKSLSAEQLNALGEKNSIPTEFVYPNAYYVQVVYPDRIMAVENGDSIIDYMANSTFQLPAPELLKNAEYAIYSRGFTFELLKDAKSDAKIQEGFPSPVEIVYLKMKTTLDETTVKEEVFKETDKTKLKEEKIGNYNVTVFPNSLVVPLDQTGQNIGKIDDVNAGLCFPSEDSVLFMSGTTSAFESYLDGKSGDERGIAAQRVARIAMDNVAAAFQYDIDFSTPNAQLVKLPIRIPQELAVVIQKEVTAFQFFFDPATPDGNLFTLNVNAKSADGANELRKTIGTSLMQFVDGISNAQKNNQQSSEANATLDGLLALLKSVQLNVEGTNVVASAKNTPEAVKFIAKGIKDINDTEIRQRYLAAEQTLQQIGAFFTRYCREHKTFPAPICADDGTPLLSWRVALLPTLGGQFKELYDQFKLDEPWNSDNNLKLLDKMPAIFASSTEAGPNKTQFLVFNSPETPFGRSPKGLKLQDVEDPASTFSVVYASPANAIEWTKPETFVFNPSKPSDSFGNYVCGVTLMGELISSPCDDSENNAKSLAALVFGTSQEDDATSEEKNSNQEEVTTEETPSPEETSDSNEVAPEDEGPATTPSIEEAPENLELPAPDEVPAE